MFGSSDSFVYLCIDREKYYSMKFPIGNEALQNEYRGTLKAFYGALKSCNREVEEGFVKYLVPYYSPSKADHL